MKYFDLNQLAPAERGRIEIMSQKDTNAALRRALRAAFPGVKFSLVGSRGSSYSHLTVAAGHVMDRDRANEICDRYCLNRFDGMTDGHDATNHAWQLDDGTIVRPGLSGVLINGGMEA